MPSNLISNQDLIPVNSNFNDTYEDLQYTVDDPDKIVVDQVGHMRNQRPNETGYEVEPPLESVPYFERDAYTDKFMSNALKKQPIPVDALFRDSKIDKNKRGVYFNQVIIPVIAESLTKVKNDLPDGYIKDSAGVTRALEKIHYNIVNNVPTEMDAQTYSTIRSIIVAESKNTPFGSIENPEASKFFRRTSYNIASSINRRIGPLFYSAMARLLSSFVPESMSGYTEAMLNTYSEDTINSIENSLVSLFNMSDEEL